MDPLTKICCTSSLVSSDYNQITRLVLSCYIITSFSELVSGRGPTNQSLQHFYKHMNSSLSQSLEAHAMEHITSPTLHRQLLDSYSQVSMGGHFLFQVHPSMPCQNHEFCGHPPNPSTQGWFSQKHTAQAAISNHPHTVCLFYYIEQLISGKLRYSKD